MNVVASLSVMPSMSRELWFCLYIVPPCASVMHQLLVGGAAPRRHPKALRPSPRHPPSVWMKRFALYSI